MKRIDSRANPQFKSLRLLASSVRERRRQQLTLLDGPHLLESCLDSTVTPRLVAVSEDACGKPGIAALLERVGAAPVLCFPAALFAQLASVDTPAGILAVIDIPRACADRIDGDLLVLLEAVQDPGNVGTIIRSAAAAGADAVLLSAQCADPWSPRVLRAAMGAHFALAIHPGADLDAAVSAFRGCVVASAGQGGLPPQAVDLRGPVALVFGSEGAGLSPGLLRAASACVTIPLARGIESLNVGAAAAVVLFERVRQRAEIESMLAREASVNR